MEFMQFTPFIRISVALILGVVGGVYSAVLSLLLLLPRLSRYRIYTLIIWGGVALNFIYCYNPKVSENVESRAVVVVGDSISNYNYGKILKFNNSTLRVIPHVIVDIPPKIKSSISVGDTVETSVFVESLSKFDTDTKSVFSSLKLQGIRQVAYLYEDKPICIAKQNGVNSSIFAKFVARAQNNVTSAIDSLGVNSRNSALLKALIVGDKSSLDGRTKLEYRRCGIAHALAISGFHIAIIALILNLLLFKMHDIKVLKLIKMAIVVLLLWLFAIVSGFSASVVRAVIMFSLYQISTLFVTSRYNNYNILAFAFAVMVAISPSVVWSVGFQLSYLAVATILLFSNLFGEWLSSFKGVAKFLITSTTLSLAISLVLMPLTLYYFGSGSLLSVISNVVITILLPMLYVVVLLALLTSCTLFTPIINYLFALLDAMINMLSSYSFLYIENFEFDFISLLLSYMIVVLLFVVIFLRRENGKSQVVKNDDFLQQ